MGDIHGAYKALEQVLERCNFDPENDTLIQLGDLTDGWSQTWEVVEYFHKLKREHAHHVFIRGNHDVWLHDWLMYGKRPYLWTTQGGQAALDSYMLDDARQETWKSHADFMKNQVDFYELERSNGKILFIHGGFAYAEGTFPATALFPVNAGTIAKECHWDRSLYQTAKTAHFMRAKSDINHYKLIDEQMAAWNEIYIGHTAESNAKINCYLGKLWNCDSGSGWNGRLGVVDIDTKETWYSDYCSDLYFGENGRQ